MTKRVSGPAKLAATAKGNITQARDLAATATKDIERYDRVDALDMLELARRHLEAACSALRTSLANYPAYGRDMKKQKKEAA